LLTTILGQRFLCESCILSQCFEQKNVSHIRKKTFYLQFCMGTPVANQKSIFNTPKVIKKIHMGSIRQSLKPKHKKVIETPNQPIEIKKSAIKVRLVLQK
jgi:hypothetical protein